MLCIECSILLHFITFNTLRLTTSTIHTPFSTHYAHMRCDSAVLPQKEKRKRERATATAKKHQRITFMPIWVPENNNAWTGMNWLVPISINNRPIILERPTAHTKACWPCSAHWSVVQNGFSSFVFFFSSFASSNLWPWRTSMHSIFYKRLFCVMWINNVRSQCTITFQFQCHHPFTLFHSQKKSQAIFWCCATFRWALLIPIPNCSFNYWSPPIFLLQFYFIICDRCNQKWLFMKAHIA